jgi:hypothetical protein
MVDGSVRRWTQTSPKNLNMNSSNDNVFVRIMYFLDEMISSSDFDKQCATPTVEIFREFYHKL